MSKTEEQFKAALVNFADDYGLDDQAYEHKHGISRANQKVAMERCLREVRKRLAEGAAAAGVLREEDE